MSGGDSDYGPLISLFHYNSLATWKHGAGKVTAAKGDSYVMQSVSASAIALGL